MGDVAAKEESQASIAQLLGYAVGMSLLTFSHSAGYLYSIFALAVPIHLCASTLMLKLANFELLTLPRVTLLAKRSAVEDGESNKAVSCLKELDESKETGLFGEFYKRRRDHLVTLAPKVEDFLDDTEESVTTWEICADAFAVRHLLLYSCTDQS